MLITEILARNGRMYADETALIERDPEHHSRREISWCEFDRQANQIANLLRSRGVGPGSRVVHLFMNSLEWLPLYFGILRCGAWVVPLNFRFDSENIRHCVAVADADVIFFGPEFFTRIAAVKEQMNSVKHFFSLGPCDLDGVENYLDLIDNFEPEDPQLELHYDDSAALYFTSGTTGLPKPILLTHGNLESSCIVENRHHLQHHDDNLILIPPLYHTGAKMHWFGNFIVGAKAVILKGAKPEWILDAVSEEKGTIVWLLVPWAQDILTAIEDGAVDLGKYQLEQWRLMHIGAQPVPPSLIQEWLNIFPQQEYDTNYGLSESTGPGCVHLGMGNTHKVGAIGIPGFDWECRVVDALGSPLPQGEKGELVVRGPGVMREYFNNPEETARTLRDGWLHTGDIALIDEDGFIFLVDRKKDIIITGGENIFPVEIEDFLQGHKDINDVAVIGLPDERLGESVAAIVDLKPGRRINEDDIETFCQDLPRYKRPRRFFFDNVPRNPTGKIEKPKLREKYAGHQEMFKL